MKKLSQAFAAATLAMSLSTTPLAAESPRDNQLLELFETWSDRLSSEGGENKNLLDAVQNSDLERVQNLLASGVRPVKNPESFDGVLYDALWNITVSAHQVGAKNNRGVEIVRLLVEHGAVLRPRELISVMSYGVGAASSLEEATQLVLDSVQDYWQEGDFTEVLFGMHYKCKPNDLRLILEAGADPNDTEFLIQNLNITDVGVTFSYDVMPLHRCVRAAIKNPNNRQEYIDAVNVLLDYGADPNLVIEATEKFYYEDSDANIIDMINGNAHSSRVPRYEISSEAKALLELIVSQREERRKPQSPKP